MMLMTMMTAKISSTMLLKTSKIFCPLDANAEGEYGRTSALAAGTEDVPGAEDAGGAVDTVVAGAVDAGGAVDTVVAGAVDAGGAVDTVVAGAVAAVGAAPGSAATETGPLPLPRAASKL
eukprot:247827_1